MRFFDPLPLPQQDAAILCRLIGFLREANGFENIRETLRQIWGALPTGNLYPKEAGRPAWGWFYFDRNSLVLIDGISDQAQATEVMNSYQGRLQSGYANPDNPSFTNWAQNILDRMLQWTLFTGQNLTIAGWSAGGAVAARIPTLRLATHGTDAVVRVISFGAPRVGSTGLGHTIRQDCTASRYMAFDDPIPNFPPRSGTYTWVPFAVGIRASLRFANFVHHYGGLVIDGLGNIFEGTIPTHGDITPRVALDMYWNGLAADSLSAHSLSHYASLLSMQGAVHRPHRPAEFAPQEHTQNTEPADVRRQERNTFQAVRDLQSVQESQAVVIPRERLARAIRQGRVFYVVLNDVPLMMTPTRRRAQGLARDLNHFLRRNQSTAFVDPVALTAQINAFLLAAADASSGIRPTLITQIPQ